MRLLLTGHNHPPFCVPFPTQDTPIVRSPPRYRLATMSESSSREMSRSPSNSSQSTNITRPSSEDIRTKPSASQSAFLRWRPSYHLQAPSGWMNVSYHLMPHSHEQSYLLVRRTLVHRSMTPKQTSTTYHINPVWISPMRIGEISRGVRPHLATWSHGTSNMSPLSHQIPHTMARGYSQAARCLVATVP